MFHVGIDDTDSLNGGCTTWVASRVIEALLPDYELIGAPRLVRLNPNVLWKTRGNGAVALTFGRGAGERQQVGALPEGPVMAHAEAEPTELDVDELFERVFSVISEEAKPSAQPGLIVSEVRPTAELYWQGVRGIVGEVGLREALEGTAHAGLNGGRGLVGAACALSWSPRNAGAVERCSWELLGYRNRRRWGSPRDISVESVAAVAEIEGTFGCRDPDGSPAMVPHSPCPVMWGLRGLQPELLVAGFGVLGPERPERWLLWQTNQATDDHDEVELPVGSKASVRLAGTVASFPQSRRGGHRFFTFASDGSELECAAFEPSGDFRQVVDQLVPGDALEVCGSLDAGVLKLEKLHVITLAPRQRKPPNPLCPKCSARTHSAGKNAGYRCRPCGIKLPAPVPEEVVPTIAPGWYDPPASARRHLVRPAKLMEAELAEQCGSLWCGNELAEEVQMPVGSLGSVP
ncbi:MAG: tRNA(Ile)(2)-agmatinylcytidine synthase [Candidatus Thermoplasmatota archaeon]|nr:tRNA(Ile)(2)-agmatinylcytidine synthase [Candidatus Thermoplasmatota archaeon]